MLPSESALQSIGTFPPHVAAMIGFHHSPHPSRDHFDMTSLVHTADWLAWQSGRVASEHTQGHPLAPEVETWLAFDEATWDWVKAEAEKQFAACADLLQIAKEGK